MQKHIKNYLVHYWLDSPDNIMCEFCNKELAVDLHHIQPRSKFWKKTKHLQDEVSNIIALCRLDHQKAHFQIKPYIYKDELQEIHNNNL